MAEKEIWKTYPEIPFIEASNLGRIRTKDRYVTCSDRKRKFVKGVILKQWENGRGYLYVTVGLNGKFVHLRVQRVVATCFIPNPDNLPEVNHKDNDRTNNSVDNLEWCTSQYNQDYKKNFGTSPAQLQGRTVFAVDLKTGKVLRYESQAEAARQLGVSCSRIRDVIKGRQKTSHGYWFTEDENEITEKKIQEIKSNMKLHPVIVIKPETSEVLLFDSQSEAARQLEVSVSHINAVVKGKRNKTGGYWFCYADSTAVEKTRAKFGDKIAEKVEKLLQEHQ